uniref:Uncharacterized protein n=1 Tax=viral metagenome TaxID=1070528 RepID=A0A6C0J8A3_9ZZZZ
MNDNITGLVIMFSDYCSIVSTTINNQCNVPTIFHTFCARIYNILYTNLE